jgi:hypothetical protein
MCNNKLPYLVQCSIAVIGVKEKRPLILNYSITVAGPFLGFFKLKILLKLCSYFVRQLAFSIGPLQH